MLIVIRDRSRSSAIGQVRPGPDLAGGRPGAKLALGVTRWETIKALRKKKFKTRIVLHLLQ